MFHVEQLPTDQTSLELLHESARVFGCQLEDTQFVQLNRYVLELLKWNKKSNLTGCDSIRKVIGNLITDSLAPISLIEDEKPGSILDVGTGGGIPGLPLRIVLPFTTLTLVEPNQKKVAFLQHVVGTLDLKNVRVEPGRIEKIGKNERYHGVIDWVVIKALRLEGVLPYVSQVLSERGVVISWRSEPSVALKDSFGYRVINEIPYTLPFGFGPRVLSVLGR